MGLEWWTDCEGILCVCVCINVHWKRVTWTRPKSRDSFCDCTVDSQGSDLTGVCMLGQMRACVERWVVSVGLDEFCSSKPRHAASNAVEEEKESERIPVCWHKVCSCFWKILHPAPVCMTGITRAAELPVLTPFLTPLYQALDLHTRWAHKRINLSKGQIFYFSFEM